MLKDTMRELFSHKELFEIAQYSKIPFYRIAAFDLYTQTNYSTNSVVRFLKNGCIATNLQVPTRYSVGEIPEGYVSLPCPLTPTLSSIRLKMFEMVDPTATIVTRKPDWSYDTIPKYPENIPLDYESFVELRAYLNSYYNGYTTGVFSMAHSKLPNPSFRMRLDKMDFGKIDLNQIDSDQSGFELRGSILVTNNGNSTIYVSSKASAHTMCLKSTYTIGPKEEVLIEFKSLIDVKNISPSIERSITLQNSKTGEAQLFKFNAQFITK